MGNAAAKDLGRLITGLLCVLAVSAGLIALLIYLIFP